MKKRKIKKINVGPLTVMIFITFVIGLLSFLFAKIGLRGILTDNDTLETSIVTVRNLFSSDGLKFIFGESLNDFRNIEPLVATIVSLITISIMEVSGLFKHIFSGLKNVKGWILTASIIFISIISTIIGNYSYTILLPLVSALYRTINKDPKYGIITTFIGITIGYGVGLTYNYQDILLGNITNISASNILENYSFNALSNIFVMIVSTIVLTVVATIMCENRFSKKIRNVEQDELILSTSAFKASSMIFLVMLLVTIWSIVPGLPLSGWMLGSSNNSYLVRLFGNTAPFKDGIILILVCMSLICSYVYGKLSRNIKDSREYNKSISKTFQNTGFIFAGLFFASIMINVLEWTNIPQVISLNLIELIGKTEMSGAIIVGFTLLICIVMTILNPNTLFNWEMASPILTTSLARANISPSFTLMIFKVGDSIGKCFSPFYIYFVLMLGFLYKYDSQNDDINFFGTMKKMMPVLLVLTLTYIIIIVGWGVLGLPTGIGTNLTL